MGNLIPECILCWDVPLGIHLAFCPDRGTGGRSCNPGLLGCCLLGWLHGLLLVWVGTCQLLVRRIPWRVCSIQTVSLLLWQSWYLFATPMLLARASWPFLFPSPPGGWRFIAMGNRILFGPLLGLFHKSGWCVSSVRFEWSFCSIVQSGLLRWLFRQR